jgi:Outer membrane protein beta-barrel domain
MIREKNILLGFGVAAVLLLGSVSVAQAQYGAPPPNYGYPPPPPPPRRGMYRDGLVLGVSLGLGNISAANCGDICGVGGALEFHIGGMLNPRLALMGDFMFNAHSIPNSDGTLVHSVYTIALQYWVTDIIWLKGGLGGGNIQIQSQTSNLVYTDESGFAFMGAAGIEILQSSNFALDLQLRVGHGFYNVDGDATSTSFLIGVNWY